MADTITLPLETEEAVPYSHHETLDEEQAYRERYENLEIEEAIAIAQIEQSHNSNHSEIKTLQPGDQDSLPVAIASFAPVAIASFAPSTLSSTANRAVQAVVFDTRPEGYLPTDEGGERSKPHDGIEPCTLAWCRREVRHRRVGNRALFGMMAIILLWNTSLVACREYARMFVQVQDTLYLDANRRYSSYSGNSLASPPLPTYISMSDVKEVTKDRNEQNRQEKVSYLQCVTRRATECNELITRDFYREFARANESNYYDESVVIPTAQANLETCQRAIDVVSRLVLSGLSSSNSSSPNSTRYQFSENNLIVFEDARVIQSMNYYADDCESKVVMVQATNNGVVTSYQTSATSALQLAATGNLTLILNNLTTTIQASPAREVYLNITSPCFSSIQQSTDNLKNAMTAAKLKTLSAVRDVDAQYRNLFYGFTNQARSAYDFIANSISAGLDRGWDGAATANKPTKPPTAELDALRDWVGNTVYTEATYSGESGIPDILMGFRTHLYSTYETNIPQINNGIVEWNMAQSESQANMNSEYTGSADGNKNSQTARLFFSDYNPPPVSPPDCCDTQTQEFRNEIKRASGDLADGTGDSLKAAFEDATNNGSIPNANDILAGAQRESFVLVTEANTYIRQSFVLQPLDVALFRDNDTWIETLWRATSAIDLSYRAVHTLLLIRRFIFSSATLVPTADVRPINRIGLWNGAYTGPGPRGGASMGSLRKLNPCTPCIWFTSPFTLIVLFAVFLSFGLSLFSAMWTPWYTNYRETCVSPSAITNMTAIIPNDAGDGGLASRNMVTENWFQFARQDAYSLGDVEYADAIDRLNIQRLTMCTNASREFTARVIRNTNAYTTYMSILGTLWSQAAQPLINFTVETSTNVSMLQNLTLCDPSRVPYHSNDDQSSFNCSAISMCDVSCSGPNESSIRENSRVAGCAVQSYISSAVRLTLATFLFFCFLNAIRTVLIDGLRRLFVEKIAPPEYTYVATCDENGVLEYPPGVIKLNDEIQERLTHVLFIHKMEGFFYILVAMTLCMLCLSVLTNTLR